jgi:hypothetical protein
MVSSNKSSEKMDSIPFRLAPAPGTRGKYFSLTVTTTPRHHHHSSILGLPSFHHRFCPFCKTLSFSDLFHNLTWQKIKPMKSLLRIALLLIALYSSQATSAQSKLSEEQKKELQAKYESYKAQLNLTPEQEQKVKTINTTYFEGLAGIKESGGSKMSRLKTYRKLTNTRDKQMKEVLDKNQYQTYKKMKEEMREEMKNKRSR